MDLNFVSSIHYGASSLTKIEAENGDIIWQKGLWPQLLDANFWFWKNGIKVAAYARPAGLSISGITGSRSVWNGSYLRVCDDSFQEVDAGVTPPEAGIDPIEGIHFLKVTELGSYFMYCEQGALRQVFQEDYKAYPFPVSTEFQFSPIYPDSVYENEGAANFTWREYYESIDSETQLPVEITVAEGTGQIKFVRE